MRRLIFIAIVLATGLSAHAEDDGTTGGFRARGIGYMNCHDMLRVFPNNVLGNAFMSAYASGMITGINGMMSTIGTLPESGDMAGDISTTEFISLTRKQCRAHPAMKVTEAMTSLLLNIRKNESSSQ